ncbi:MAG: DUF1028 domain-containing protein [Verrucomicrobiae bacterium]|nr:DUF1028 domain-containing protein [Verrucomicrobiae bacterium]
MHDARHTSEPSELVATYSIVAFDPASGDLGVAVQSKFFGVGSVVPWAKAGVGAIATQAYANTAYGPDGLLLLKSGMAPAAVVETLTGADSRRDIRQLGVIGADGSAAAFTGEKCQPWAGHLVGKHFAAQGNLLAGGLVVTNMARAFEAARADADGELADWLMLALDAAEAAGGDKRGRQSAALLVVRKDGGYAGQNDRYIDLRVEDHPRAAARTAPTAGGHRQFYKRR